MAKKINTKPIKYTSRDFDSIKEDLVDYAKRYYPDTFKDFNQASFGSLMLDTVAYVGDILSFYLDYQANESFLQTSVEYNNVLKHAKQIGFNLSTNQSAIGKVALYLSVPASSTGLGPNTDYIPVLKKGSSFNSVEGTTFTLNEDIDFSSPSNEVVVSEVNQNTGVPTFFAIRAYGEVISGDIVTETITLGAYRKFLKLQLAAQNITEIISVVDSEGNEYYQTEYLSQDVIYKGVTNRLEADRQGGAMQILKPFTVPRRFVIENTGNSTFMQFGASQEITVNDDMIADPSSVILKSYGRNYITDTSFDPTNLVNSDKFGISPSNTTLTIIMRTNNSDSVNVSSGGLNIVSDSNFKFTNPNELQDAVVSSVVSSLEVLNEEPIVGNVSLPDTEELKVRVFNSFSSQNRAVTQTDYEAMIYRMPPQFGAVKRVRVTRDEDSFKRNLNAYVISENSEGQLVQSNPSIKNNLKTWIQSNKMINDTIDILDAKIINFGVKFKILVSDQHSKYDVLSNCENQLRNFFSRKYDIGENLFLTDIYKELKKVQGVVDASSVTIDVKTGGNYSNISLNILERMSPDGRFIMVPKNVIMEMKFPLSDISGVVV